MLGILVSTFILSHALIASEFQGLVVKNCDKFPYYSVNEVSGGKEVMLESIRSGVDQLRSCFSPQNNSHRFLTTKLKKLEEILRSPKEKVFECTYGKYESFFAMASLPPHHPAASKNERYMMAKHPSALFDINRMAGNFPLNMSEEHQEKMWRFYRGQLKRADIVAGERNPFYGRVENPSSLVVHEMLHWTESYHSDTSYPDFVYLSQICCFPIANVNESTREKACEVLFNADYWQEDKVKRLEEMSNDNIKDRVKKIVRLYHSHEVIVNRFWLGSALSPKIIDNTPRCSQ